MRIVVHDYSGHPGQVQLARALARRGHEVFLQYSPAYCSGHGQLTALPDDPAGFTVEAVGSAQPYDRYQPAARLRGELQYAAAAHAAITARAPDVVLLSNVPLLGHARLARRLQRARVPMVFWHQDLYSRAITAAVRRRLPALSGTVGRLTDALERGVARRSAAVVAITGAFLTAYEAWDLRSPVLVEPNWGPLAEVPVRPKDNAWARQHGLQDRPTVLYAGTLGLKHDPALLLELARRLPESVPDVVVVVVSEGRGRQWLEQAVADEPLSSLLLLDFQDYAVLPDVLGSADVLVALLEADASRYSVPSKVLTYLCAGRSVVAAMPADNWVSEVLLGSAAGRVVEPGDHEAGVAAVRDLLQSSAARSAAGRAARAFAEEHFDVDVVAERFEQVLRRAAGDRLA